MAEFIQSVGNATMRGREDSHLSLQLAEVSNMCKTECNSVVQQKLHPVAQEKLLCKQAFSYSITIVG